MYKRQALAGRLKRVEEVVDAADWLARDRHDQVTLGQAVSSIDDLFDALQAAGEGTVELGIVRGTEERSVQVALGG